jgi:flagellar biosynthetic protein FlhB
MTRQEQKQEQKDSDGDPQIKAKLRQIRQAKARQRIAQTVPKATLVITNPTHFAVALRYVQGETAAPICVAKGVDELAFRIRDLAKSHSIPVIEDPPLARALYATVEIDDTIPKEHYAAVAKIVGFILGAAKRRARPLRPPSRPRLN